MRLTTVAIRRPPISKIPKFWIPNVDATQALDAKVIHWDLVTRFTSGSATVIDLWDWVETGLTYLKTMQILAREGLEFTDDAQAAVADQLGMYEAVIARYTTTGRVGFDGPQLAKARAAAVVFDSLIELDRNGAAVRAALWSTEQINKIKREFKC